MSAILAEPRPDSHPIATQDDRLRWQIRERTRAILLQSQPLCASHHTEPPAPEIRFDLHGQAAGQVRWRCNERPLLRYNLAFARNHPEDFLVTTVVHEVAHLVTMACFGRTRPHGTEWRSVMQYLGVDRPQRCHDFPLDSSTPRSQRRWAYSCDCRDHQLSTTRHNRARSGATSYLCRTCGSTLRPTTQ